MARGRLILAIYLALILVILPVSAAWSVDPHSKDTQVRGGLRTDGAGDSGHPWDDGTGSQPQPDPDSSASLLTALPLTPPVISSGGTKWVGSILRFIWERVQIAKVSPKMRQTRHR
jgi:hypothetical protein